MVASAFGCQLDIVVRIYRWLHFLRPHGAEPSQPHLTTWFQTMIEEVGSSSRSGAHYVTHSVSLGPDEMLAISTSWTLPVGVDIVSLIDPFCRHHVSQ